MNDTCKIFDTRVYLLSNTSCLSIPHCCFMQISLNSFGIFCHFVNSTFFSPSRLTSRRYVQFSPTKASWFKYLVSSIHDLFAASGIGNIKRLFVFSNNLHTNNNCRLLTISAFLILWIIVKSSLLFFFV